MKFPTMTYKGTLLVIVLAVLALGANFGANAIRNSDVAHSTPVWEGECPVGALETDGDDVVLSATCNGSAIRTGSAEAIVFYGQFRDAPIHCVIYEAGNNNCRAGVAPNATAESQI